MSDSTDDGPCFRAQAVLLTVAGHDPCSGAGITADIATFAAHGFFGVSAVTALTVQSTQGVAAVQPADPVFLGQTLDHLAADMPPSGVKIGMLGTAETVSVVAAFLRSPPIGQGTPVVLDPVLRATSGAALLSIEALSALHSVLLPAVTWVTPNWVELAALTGRPHLASIAEAEDAMHLLAGRHAHLHIIATGGDQPEPVDLLRLPSGEVHRFVGRHIASNATHGTGCAFSSSLLAHLVRGYAPVDAVAGAKHFVAEAIRRAPGVGHSKGPLNLLWPLQAGEPLGKNCTDIDS